MKKFLTILLALVIVFTMTVSVFAEVENFAKSAKWTQGHSGGVSEKNGIYTATGIKAAYCSPFIDILPAVKAALGTDTEAELVIKFKIRAEFTEGNEGEVTSARTLIRGGSLKKEEIEDWNAAYDEAVDGETFFKADGGGNIMCYIGSGFSFTDDEWTTVIIEFTVSDVIVNNDMVAKWNFCIDTISKTDLIESIYFKDFIVAHYDDELFEEDEEEDVVDVQKPAKTPKPESNEPVNTENFAANLKWSGFGLTVTEADGVITATNFKHPYDSPSIEVLPAMKAALGDDDDIEIFIVFDARVKLKEGNEGESISAQALFRGTNALDVKASDIDEWKEAYTDSFDDAEPLFINSQGNIMKYLQGVIFTENWKTFVIPLELEGEQITNPAISKWTFCFDTMSKYEMVENLEIKNFAITFEEPEEEETPADKPATDKPAENKPAVNATPTPYVVWATPIGYVDPAATPAPGGSSSQNIATATPVGNNNGGDSSMLPLIIGGAAVVVIAGALVTIIVVKKKKNGKTE